MKQIERYGKMVWENESFEKQRKDNCLCFLCENMNPGAPDHCKIASKFYAICVEHGCAFILTRCAEWVPKK